MKKSILIACFILFQLKLYSTQLIHAYFGDYREIVRLVFVLSTETHYSTFMDTDNRAIHIHINETRLSPSILPMDFSSTALIDRVEYEQVGRDLRATIFTNVVYYAEAFFHIDSHFKIVIDVYRQREPATLEQAMDYLHFFLTVGFLDRARALQRRIDNNDFLQPIAITREVATPRVELPPPPPPLPPTPPVEMPRDAVIPTPENPLLYLKPDITFLTHAQQIWITEAFRIYDIFREIHNIIEQAERNLQLYDAQRTVDISFVETMSMSFNSLADANVKINEVRLQFGNLIERRTMTTHAAIVYTETMIGHIMRILSSYQVRVVNLQNEYNRRINR